MVVTVLSAVFPCAKMGLSLSSSVRYSTGQVDLTPFLVRNPGSFSALAGQPPVPSAGDTSTSPLILGAKSWTQVAASTAPVPSPITTKQDMSIDSRTEMMRTNMLRSATEAVSVFLSRLALDSSSFFSLSSLSLSDFHFFFSFSSMVIFPLWRMLMA